MLLHDYSRINFWVIELENNDPVPSFEPAGMRVSIPTDFAATGELIQKGFTMIDRTIDVKVPINGNKVDLTRFCRMPVLRSDGYAEEIRKIAEKSFQEDYRFKTSRFRKQNKVYEQFIDIWMEGEEEVFVCLYQGQVAGFADVRCLEEYGGMPFIYLAAVDERYRAAGTALSLYAGVFEYYKKQKVKFVYGKISSQNMAIMNLYAAFGAQFLRVRDIYIKEGRADNGGQY